VRVILGKVTGVDSKRRTVIIEGGTLDERRITYDYLVLATGARHSYFSRDEMGRCGARPEEGRRRHPAFVGAS
jgi:NADH dehydrogenase FAD-containing subunit